MKALSFTPKEKKGRWFEADVILGIRIQGDREKKTIKLSIQSTIFILFIKHHDAYDQKAVFSPFSPCGSLPRCVQKMLHIKTEESVPSAFVVG